MKKSTFIKNTFFLTATSFILRFAGMYFRIFLSDKIGSDGIGLYQMLMSVFVFFTAFIAGGLTTAATRQIKDRLCANNHKAAKSAVGYTVAVSLAFSLFCALICFLFAEFISVRFIKDALCLPAVKIMGFILPFMAVSAVLRGWFIARGKAEIPSVSLIIEQTVRLASIFFIIPKNGDTSRTLFLVMLCDMLGEAVSMVFLAVNYFSDSGKFQCGAGEPPLRFFKEHFHIVLPMTAGKYLNSFLRTAENLIVPSLLAVTLGAKGGVSAFGLIKGMALPLLLFPASALSSVTVLIIPELSAALSQKNFCKIRYAVGRNFEITAFFSFITAAIFYVLAKPLAVCIYHEPAVAPVIQCLAPLIPVMYFDTTADGILKGLDKQTASFLYSTGDCILRLCLIYLLVPRFGMLGFLLVMFASN
ncbi:MAG: oligosaccharide flippase family protein, partial [Oscillospiraceae bacterium]|nr:oligosaccharide flippase family protein [Candidatus Equicaccousia limihippi]